MEISEASRFSLWKGGEQPLVTFVALGQAQTQVYLGILSVSTRQKYIGSMFFTATQSTVFRYYAKYIGAEEGTYLRSFH